MTPHSRCQLFAVVRLLVVMLALVILGAGGGLRVALGVGVLVTLVATEIISVVRFVQLAQKQNPAVDGSQQDRAIAAILGTLGTHEGQLDALRSLTIELRTALGEHAQNIGALLQADTVRARRAAEETLLAQLEQAIRFGAPVSRA